MSVLKDLESDEDSGDEISKGAVIRLNETFYAMIFKLKVIFFLNENERWIKTRPIPVQMTKFKFPAYTNAVFESMDGYFYFIKNDKYCKRRLEDKYGVRLETNVY